MKDLYRKTKSLFPGIFAGIIACIFILGSCTDDYIYDNKEPDWLGASIYGYMKSDGHFTNYTRLIEDLGYTDVLGKTGSKTMFVANDSVFDAFYKKNSWGVTRYEQLTNAQKTLILNYGMINNAYLIDMLANYFNGTTIVEGSAFRRETAVSILDSIPFNIGSALPATQYWKAYQSKGIHLMKDNTAQTLTCFTQKQLSQSQITNEDFYLITGVNRTDNDAHVLSNKILKKDITCKNGYLNLLGTVMTPPMNMAQYIFENPTTSLFSSVLERFSAPYYDMANTVRYRQLHPEFTDSIFVKRYFSKLNGSGSYIQITPDKQILTSDMLLPFDPGWNRYVRSGYVLESDMAAMFVPTNDAMKAYFNSGSGAVLRDRFKVWDSIPLNILPPFIKRHMRTSLTESVPSKFSTMADEDNSALPVTKDDIAGSYVGSNGVVYLTNKVYPPDDYESVYGPILLSANDVAPDNKTKIWKWAIAQNDFRLYLNSLISRYSFFVPTDEYFTKYLEPLSLAKDVNGALKFWYNSKTSAVNATVYRYDKSTGVVGDSVALITSSSFIVNRLLDLLNSHIVVGDVESGKQFYITKGNVAIKVNGGTGTNLKVQSGGNISLNEVVNVNRAYNQGNGKTYFIDKPIQSPYRSVYKVLSDNTQFSAFFSLMIGFPTSSSSVLFVNKLNYCGIDYNIKFFNTFNYTVYVPTNDAIADAIQRGVITPWESQGSIVGINQMTDASKKAAAISRLERFIRYHFQDNSVFVDQQSGSYVYQSSTMKLDDAKTQFNTFKNKYYKIGVNCKPGKIELVSEKNDTVEVMTTNGLYNIMTRDYVFSNKPSTFKNIDGTGSGTDFSSSSIYTSSSAVIHQINKVLDFQ